MGQLESVEILLRRKLRALEATGVEGQYQSAMRHWEPPAGFRRPAYDAALLKQSLCNLKRAIAPGLIQTQEYRNVEAACREILR